MTRHYLDYFLDDQPGSRQLRPFPKKWMDTGRFKVGDQIQYLRRAVFGTVNLKGRTAVATEVHPGTGPFPPVRTVFEGEAVWDGQRPGWLVIDFGPEVVIGTLTSPKGSRVKVHSLVARLEEEDVYWRKM